MNTEVEISDASKRSAEFWTTEHLEAPAREALGRSTPARRDGESDVRTPQVFLMDEPLSNLDAKLRVQMRAEISRLQHAPRE